MNSIIPENYSHTDDSILELESLLAFKDENLLESQQEISECYQEYVAMGVENNYSVCN